jgi:hypothetical protein
MTHLCECKYCEDIIDRLIFSNMQQDAERPYALYINFGVYRISYQGNSRNSLADAKKHFKEKIASIVKGWDYK